MSAPVLTLQNINLTFGGDPLLNGADLMLNANERVCLIGRNGSGKSTLLKIAAGLVEPDSGERFIQPGATVRYMHQEPDLSTCPTILAYVEAGLEPGDDPHRARYLIEHLDLVADQPTGDISGGEARRAALARTLAPEPDILLLDEPTNHLDLPAIEWLEAELKSSRSAIVLISHDRRFLENLAQSAVWLDRGITRKLSRGFADFEEWRDDILHKEELEHHKLGRKIAMEEDWLRYGVTARRKRNQRRLGLLHEMRRRLRTELPVRNTMAIGAVTAETSGKLVIEAKDLSKSYGERPIVESFSIRIQRGERLGIIGPNGAGKTTLINLLTGVLTPDGGTVTLGQTVQMVTLDQKRESLDPNWTLSDALTGGGGETVLVRGEKRHVIGYMKDFLFSPEQRRTPISRLSGGERGRLMLARALAASANLLVLDEPTNDLDLETLDLLQEFLSDYDGTILLVSHDRDFLDRIATSTLVSEGNGKWTEHPGGYSDAVLKPARAANPRPAGKRTPHRPVPSQAPARKVKLSFKQKHALETLPAQVAEYQRQIADLTRQLDDPAFYTRDADSFAEAGARLQRTQELLSAAEDDWLELEMLREELEGAS